MTATRSEHAPDQRAEPYAGQPLPFVVDDLVTAGALHDDVDERLWVPQAPGVDFRPLLLNVTQGYWVNVLRVRTTGILSRHRHAGPVHALTLQGRWHYLEHDWWAEEGSYAFEPPGDIHTLEVPADCAEMRTLFHVSGAYVYVDVDGRPVGVEDVFSKLEAARRHYGANGIGVEAVDARVR
jgi:2,4'-dihydroxyacetophenone dioxygenase